MWILILRRRKAYYVSLKVMRIWMDPDMQRQDVRNILDMKYMKTACEALYAQLFEKDAVTASSLFLVDKRVFQLQ